VTRRSLFLRTLALAIGLLPVASPSRAALRGVTIRWEVDPSGTTSGVSVVGLSPEALKALVDPSWTPERRAGLFSIAVEGEGPKRPDRPSMLGSYRVEGDALRFTSRYPFDRGRTYLATFRPGLLTGGSDSEVTSSHLVPKPTRASTIVTKVTPSGDRVPENLLKFYLHFSQPMSRGEVYDRVRLLKDDGHPVDLPFLRVAEELWDPTGTRLTLLIDPGRIKRGLKPREENGPVLEAGRAYTLVIDPGWPDAEGDPLRAEFRKRFRAEAADETQPDPKTWKIARAAASTREPLTLTFPEALDGALIESGLTLIDAGGDLVDGRVEVGANETLWKFTPEKPWLAGDYQLVIDADLEDLAGNSILRPFEVDVQRDTPTRPEPKRVHLPIAIRAKGR
jgi:hypothetical protein